MGKEVSDLTKRIGRVPKRTYISNKHGAVLKLDNGVTVVCGSDTDDYTAGSHITVFNKDGTARSGTKTQYLSSALLYSVQLEGCRQMS